MGGPKIWRAKASLRNFFGVAPLKGPPKLPKNIHYRCKQWLQNIDSFQVTVIEFVITYINWTTNGAISKQAHFFASLAYFEKHTYTYTIHCKHHAHSTSVIITTVFFLVFIYCRIERIETLDDRDLLTQLSRTMRTLLFMLGFHWEGWSLKQQTFNLSD